tara:strand:- start:228 stop:812 length:585 start_codon:yes stop_codon:yes gene_type:complete
MKIIELVLDEENVYGVDAISIVSAPAISEHFVTLKEDEPEIVRFKEIDKERKIMLGAALIPNLPIYRNDPKNGEYYVFMSKETVRQASQRFLELGLQGEATIEHKEKLSGCVVVESWIKEGEHDKSMNYGLDYPDGTWVISMRASDTIWEEQVKTGKVKGFSIEAAMLDRMKIQKEQKGGAMLKEIEQLVQRAK